MIRDALQCLFQSSILTDIQRKVTHLMSATDNLTAAVASLTETVSTLAANVTTETNTLAAQHAELLAAIANGGNNDPAIQTAADAIGAQVTALQAVAASAAQAVADNPDPAAPAA